MLRPLRSDDDDDLSFLSARNGAGHLLLTDLVVVLVGLFPTQVLAQDEDDGVDEDEDEDATPALFIAPPLVEEVCCPKVLIIILLLLKSLVGLDLSRYVYGDSPMPTPPKLASLTSAWRRSTRSFLRMYVCMYVNPLLIYVCVCVSSWVCRPCPCPRRLPSLVWVAWLPVPFVGLRFPPNRMNDFHALDWLYQRKSTRTETGSLAP